jgi:hypothetical protein
MTDSYTNTPPQRGPYSKTPERPRLPPHPFPFPGPYNQPVFPDLPHRVYLMIRGAFEDDGTRPLASLGGGSPDILVEGPTTTIITLTGIAYLVPAPGSVQRLVARVWNLGSDASVTARVRFWEVRTLQGTAPEPALIGRAFRGVPGQASISVSCPVPWMPTNPRRLSVMIDVSDSVHDPLATAFAPLADRHVAQKIIVSE